MKPFIEIKHDDWDKNRIVLLKLHYDDNKSIDLVMNATCKKICINHMKIVGWTISLSCYNLSKIETTLFLIFLTTIPTCKNAVVIRDMIGSMNFGISKLDYIDNKIELFYPIIPDKIKQLINGKSLYLTTSMDDNRILQLMCESKKVRQPIYGNINLYKIS